MSNVQNRDLNTVQRVIAPAALKFSGAGLGDRQVAAKISVEITDRAGDIVVVQGIDTAAYLKNPVVLFQHDATMPIARAVSLAVVGNFLTAVAQFPPLGTNAKSDEIYGLIKSGIISATSIGFIPKKYEPIDRRDPYAGYRFLKSELLEFSFVSVPANSEALVTGKDALAKLRRPRQTRTERMATADRLRREIDQRFPLETREDRMAHAAKLRREIDKMI
jgi:HK97 family phage prohead protease